MRLALGALLLGCGGAAATAPEPETPTPIGASAELRAEERQQAQGTAAAVLAQMPEADLTTPEGVEVLSFSAGSVMAVGTILMALSGRTDEENECYRIERTESERGERVVLRSDGCPDGQSQERTVTGTMIVEKRQTSCGEWRATTFRGWTMNDERPCGSTGSPKGARTIDGRIVSDECQSTLELDVVVGGDGLEEHDGQCRPVRRTAIRYLLRGGGDGLEGSPMNGEGEAGIAGVGKAEVETIDEVLGQAGCTSEARSGRTRARAGGHVAEVTYDGASECTRPGSAPYTIDGQPAGTTKHACAAGGEAPIAGLAPLLLALLLRRRR